LYPLKGWYEFIQNKYYWIEGSDTRYLFVDSIGDAWFFKNRVDFELAIARFKRQGPANHLQGSIHYSQVSLVGSSSLIPSRYARILKNRVITTESEPNLVAEPYDQIQDILDFEFNKPKPPKLGNSLGLDFEAIAREAIGELKPSD
jgi:hypothetical protein